jgi:hypothetical protein
MSKRSRRGHVKPPAIRPPTGKAVDPAPKPDRSELRLMRQAARNGWGVPDQLKNEAIYQTSEIMSSTRSNRYLRLAAVKTLTVMDKIDQGNDWIAIARQKANLDETLSACDIVREMEADILAIEHDDDDRGNGRNQG